MASLVFMLLLVAGVVRWMNGWLSPSPVLVAIAAIGFVVSTYHMLMDVLQSPKTGLATLLNFISAKLFVHRVKKLSLDQQVRLDDVTIEKGASNCSHHKRLRNRHDVLNSQAYRGGAPDRRGPVFVR